VHVIRLPLAFLLESHIIRNMRPEWIASLFGQDLPTDKVSFGLTGRVQSYIFTKNDIEGQS